jgi:hypothetical protein
MAEEFLTREFSKWGFPHPVTQELIKRTQFFM